jgi:hypothetical protein
VVVTIVVITEAWVSSMKNLFFACGLVALSAVGAQADTAYSCVLNQAKMAPAGKYGLIIVIDAKTGKAEARNGVVKQDERQKAPSTPDVRRGSDGTLCFTWTDEDVRFDSYSTDLDWRVTIGADGALDATLSPVSYPPSWHYKGTCEIEHGRFTIS